MIDINNPKSEFIFKAAGFLDRLKNHCRQYVLQPFEVRQETFIKMKSECDELNLFAERNFSERLNEIRRLTDEIKLEIEKLKYLNIKTEDDNCMVCNTKLKTIDTLIKDKDLRYMTICKNCPNKIINLLTKLEEPTGVMWI